MSETKKRYENFSNYILRKNIYYAVYCIYFPTLDLLQNIKVLRKDKVIASHVTSVEKVVIICNNSAMRRRPSFYCKKVWLLATGAG